MKNQNIRAQLSQIEITLRSKIGLELIQQHFEDLQLSIIQQMDLSNLIDYLSELKLADCCLFERLMRLDAALCQLDLGLYGLCSDCESEIEASRLQSDLTEQRCSVCASRYNQEHRHELRLTH
ncbi:TraR/DksA C4-type zinc finger protein [Shewanella sp. OMA3-2]|uniref:TraR/DksA C4-type zinc finger protein n=1 Tax=Shewanella sp. OMA3-2 TaxID=2908650 RepID=UPI001F16653C|nr:TraR/DksA C4-type zinc finger protein [Shewanella sp. OMA3-2]UJF21104.1 TraR/DksA C4-type zinc finger protein [Shewanella sp. OMA3-2]